MARSVLNFFLLLVFVGALGLNALGSRDLTRRNVEVMPEMVYSPAYDSFAPNPNFPDGKTIQLPEPGTIPRGRMPLHYGSAFTELMRAGDELHNPLSLPGLAASIAGLLGSPFGQGPLLAASALMPGSTSSFADARARERGAFVYSNYCQMCHGPQGKGDGPLAQRGMPLGQPASLLAEMAVPPKVPLKDGEMFYVITYGLRNMPSHAAQLTREDRWKVILHIRSLQQKAAGEKRP